MIRFLGTHPAGLLRTAVRLCKGLRWVVLAAVVLTQGCRPDASFANRGQNGGYRGIELGDPLPRPDFTLVDTDGAPFDFRKETEGKLALLFVGFTNCPDVCPVHMAGVAAVLAEMPKLAERTRVVFITADPRRDTPARLRSWLDGFDHRFVGLRGTAAEVHAIEDALQLPRSVVPDTVGNYSVGHSALLIAFSPDGPARVVYPFGTRQTDYAHDLPRLVTPLPEGE